jgi:hypothetical protein
MKVSFSPCTKRAGMKQLPTTAIGSSLLHQAHKHKLNGVKP